MTEKCEKRETESKREVRHVGVRQRGRESGREAGASPGIKVG